MLSQTNSGSTVDADRYERLCRIAKLREMAIDHEKKERDLKGQLRFAREEGFQLGLEQAREKAREEGAILSMRKVIVIILTHRFPDQDVSTVNAILEQIADEQKLNSLFSVAMECSSVEDFLEQIK